MSGGFENAAERIERINQKVQCGGLKEGGKSDWSRITTESGEETPCYEWSDMRGDIEVCDKGRDHVGSMHPKIGEMYKSRVSGRRVDL